jgi:Zn-dependent protease with chaperone function
MADHPSQASMPRTAEAAPGLTPWFVLILMGLITVVDVVLALAFKAVFPLMRGWPSGFFQAITLGMLALVVGATCWRLWHLRKCTGSEVLAELGAVEVHDTGDALWRRLLNVVDEMALASGLNVPRVHCLQHEPGINALLIGWSQADAALCVTQGALNRLSRGELQGLVAHEFGRMAEADGERHMNLLAMVWGLSWLHLLGLRFMAPDARGRVRPPAWALGAVLASAGWLGWVCGRLLQAVVYRGHEHRADGRALQYTRSREGLGQVLRKLQHERASQLSPLQDAKADLFCFLWLSAPGVAPWLSSHPPLSERVRRLYGEARAPLMTSATPGAIDSTLEPRMALVDTGFAQSEMFDDASEGPGRTNTPSRLPPRLITPPGLSPMATEALGRLRRLSGPLQKRLAVLAFMVQPGNEGELKFWQQMTFGQSWAPEILADVQALPPAWRVPEYERLLAQMAYEPLTSRRDLIIALRNLMRADGRVTASDRLWWLAARHRMGEVAAPLGLIRPMTGQGRDLSQLHADELSHVARFSAYMARLVPVPTPGPTPGQQGQAWFAGVMRRCAVPGHSVPECAPPGADELIHALAGVQELSWSMRPQLLRAWVEEALNHSPSGLLRSDAADAMRLAAGLLDTPLPPALASHFPKG